MKRTSPVKIAKAALGILMIILSIMLSIITYSGPKEQLVRSLYLIPVSTSLIGIHMIITLNKETRFSKGLRLVFSACSIISLITIFLFCRY